MHVLIIEDEEPAAGRLIKLLNEIDPTIVVIDVIVSIKTAIHWFQHHPMPDLVFQDIHLADGQSFEIFNAINVNAPIIFITAYDEFAIQAFKLNSIDYLLKPVKKEDLEASLKKFQQFFTSKTTPVNDISKLLESLNNSKPDFKRRFIIRYGDHIKAIETNDIAYFFTEEKNNFLRTNDNKTYPIDFNLDKLETMLDPVVFFRINRQFIISIRAIDQMFAFSKSRVKVKLKPPVDEDTIVSTERSSGFKEWLDGGN